jgi:hypothetical protein
MTTPNNAQQAASPFSLDISSVLTKLSCAASDGGRCDYFFKRVAFGEQWSPASNIFTYIFVSCVNPFFSGGPLRFNRSFVYPPGQYQYCAQPFAKLPE